MIRVVYKDGGIDTELRLEVGDMLIVNEEPSGKRYTIWVIPDRFNVMKPVAWFRIVRYRLRKWFGKL